MQAIVRIRSVLVFLLVQATLALTNTFDSSCKNIIQLLKYHIIMDAVILLSTFVLIYGYTIFAELVSIVSTFLDAIVLFLIVKTLTNCTNIYQSSTCYNTVVIDIIILVIVCIVALIDIFQMFSVYKLQNITTLTPKIVEKRIRLLHLWSLPFQVGVAISDYQNTLENSLYSLIAIPLVFTPILIYSSLVPEARILSFIFTILIFVSDMINAVYSKTAYGSWCIVTLLILDTCLVIMRTVLFSDESKDKND